jgi:CRISPR-associated protein Csd2
MHGLVTDVAIKRKIRDYVALKHGGQPPFSIFVTHSAVLNRIIQDAHRALEGDAVSGIFLPAADLADKYGKAKNDREKNELARQYMCRTFYDVRAFGAVMSTNQDAEEKKTSRNAGQVRGPVQLTFARSLDPVLPLEPSITRVAVATYKEEKKRESKGTEAGTIGRKNLIPYGLFACQGFVSPNLAQDTGFTEEDLDLLWEALQNMFEHDRSASRGLMVARGLFVFKHIGTDPQPEQRARQAKLGCAPAHKLVLPGEIVEISRMQTGTPPRRFEDYCITFHTEKVPEGVEPIRMI